MKNIIEKIRLVSKSDSNETFRLIALNIYKEFANGLILAEKDLAKKSYVSEATITNFCKKINLSGYRELAILLKYELEFAKKQITSQVKNKNTDPNIKQIYEWIASKEEFYAKLSQAITKKFELNIICSYNSLDASKFLKNYLERINIKTKLISAQDYYKYHTINDCQNILIILSGRDNETLIDVLLNVILQKEDKNIFLISEVEHAIKLDFKIDNQILLDYDNEDRQSSSIKKKFTLISLFYMLIVNIKKELNIF
ncbi:hypothetical protein [Spiroplasma endosymbiont of Crioceris asparagi]|uniref:hypothetical protein n=1 Tax=Spiroplasma endosymbiont of Crioceris asparagi TaxID=3066286 RepID=UPI0030CCD3F6